MLDLEHERYRADRYRTFHGRRRTSSGPPPFPSVAHVTLGVRCVSGCCDSRSRTKRSAEPEREALIAKVFEKFDTYILTGLSANSLHFDRHWGDALGFRQLYTATA
jgi:hypothetical protein